MKKTNGFTLIETLMTILTIGILSILILPSLTTKVDEKVFVTQIQKLHTSLESWYQIAILKYGNPKNWHKIARNNSTALNYFLENTDVIKICDNNRSCPSYTTYRSLNGSAIGKSFSTTANNACAIMPDGAFLCFNGLNNGCTGYFLSTNNICGNIYVDLNGAASPNQFGIDVFLFYYTTERVIPAGAYYESLNMYCNPKYKHKRNGLDCTTWVLEKGNMQYLRSKIH